MPKRFYFSTSSYRTPGVFVLASFMAVCGTVLLIPTLPAAEPPNHLLTKAPVLPLSIDPAFQFRKNKLYFLESAQATGVLRPSDEPSLAFERQHLLYGAISGSDIRNRYGNYFTFFWRAKRTANLTMRLEYRQVRLGAYLQAREIEYPNAKGNFTSHFQITGDDYNEGGKVVQWRAVLIEDHRVIVGLTQSYLWR